MDKFSHVLERLLSFHKAGLASLPNVQKLVTLLGHPEKTFPAIHVAGSNGKGSVCHKIARALQYSGYKVGLYTSPHLHCYTERIQVSGECISKDEVVKGIEELLQLSESLYLQTTLFELTTLLALLHFRENKVDVAVIETGLGGCRDATRVVNPVLSIITSICLEHTQFLGGTIEEIGREKAGICKEKVPLVLGSTAAISSILQTAEELKCPVTIAAPQEGFYDKENQEIARIACQLLQEKFSNLQSSAIEKALLERPSCRLEQIDSLFFDVGHNPEAFKRLFTEVKRRCPEKEISAVIGLSSDKDIKECLQVAASICDRIVLVQAEGLRPAKKEAMAEVLDSLGYGHYVLEESISKAVEAASEDERYTTVVCGSFYIMDAAKKALLINR